MLGRFLGKRSIGPLSWPDYFGLTERFVFDGVSYVMPSGGQAEMTAFQASRNPIILRCFIIRGSVFSQMEFQYQRLSDDTLFGQPSLGLLEEPWPGAGTDELLMRTEFDVSRFGNSYWYIQPPSSGRPSGTLVWLDPTKMNIWTGDVDGPSGKTVGKTLLGYQTVGKNGQPEETFLPNEIVHVRPIPDPVHPFRGQSWLSSLLPDVTADMDLTQFKRSFVNNAATPNLVVTFPAGADGKSSVGREAFNKFKERMEASHTGAAAAFKTLYIGGGADVKTVGSNFEQMQLTVTQQHGETRLCLAAGVPASLVGVAEGLKGSTLNTANFASMRRSFAEVTMVPLWRHTAKAFATATKAPSGSRLWYDTSNVMFLRADMQDAANQRQSDASTMLTLINAGFDPETAVEAVDGGGDWSKLKHSGLVSVQLQPPGQASVPADGADDNPDDPLSTDSGDGRSGAAMAKVRRELDEVRALANKPIQVTVEPAPTPDVHVNVNPPDITVEAPDVRVNVEAPNQRKRRTRFEKDDNGEIIGKVEEDA